MAGDWGALQTMELQHTAEAEKTMTTPTAEKIKRAEAVRDATASARIEGQEISRETLALMDRYIAGEITIEQGLEAILKRYGSGGK